MLRTVGKVALAVEVGTNVGERVIDSSSLSAAVVVGGEGGGSCCRVVGMVGGCCLLDVPAVGGSEHTPTTLCTGLGIGKWSGEDSGSLDSRSRIGGGAGVGMVVRVGNGVVGTGGGLGLGRDRL